MAIRQISQTPVGTTDFSDLKEEVTRNARGLNTISLSNYDADTAPVVKVGSVFENNNATFMVETGDETPTGYAGVAVSTTFYLYFDASATAFIFSSTAPTWSDALQGDYNGNDRAFFSMYKDSGGTLYQLKSELGKQKIPGSLIEDLTVNNALTMNGTMKWKYFYEEINVTEGTIYDAISGWLSGTQQLPCVIGGRRSTVSYGGTHIVRTNATTIRMVLFNDSGNPAPVDILTGSTTSWPRIQIMSNATPS